MRPCADPSAQRVKLGDERRSECVWSVLSTNMEGTTLALVGAVFMASLVEFVEAFTIVLAMGVTRGWRSAIAGALAALLSLAGFTAVLGLAITTWLSESLLQLVIGTLLLVFGLQWLRSAVLRSSGHKAQHDEGHEFTEQTEASERAERTTYAGLDLFGFMVSFKGVFLEGVEVVFIVITFGLSAGALAMAVGGAVAAGLVVLVLGVALRKPIATIPENSMKYVVGILLASFGTYWSIEGAGYFRDGGAGISWPGDRLALPGLVATWFLVSRAVIVLLTRTHVAHRSGLARGSA
jgi:Ca2+/H+ antiporter, TMEM165/GDT1 family